MNLAFPLPEHILQQPCTDRDENCREILLLVSQKTSLTPCTLGRWLFVEENEIQAIQQDNHALPANERRYMVILKWINSNGSKATYHSLLKALQNSNDIPTTELVVNKLTPVSITRQFQENTLFEQRSPFTIQGDIKRLPTSGTPLSEVGSIIPSTPFSPNLSSFPEPTEEVSYQRHNDISPSSQKQAGLVLPTSDDKKQSKDSPDNLCKSEQETVNGIHASTSSASSHRPASLDIPPDCPAHQRKENYWGDFTDSGSPFGNMPMCTSQFGQFLQQRMNSTIIKYKAKTRAAFVSYHQLQEKFDYVTSENQFQKDELARRGSKLQKLIEDTHYIHSENHKLRQELELNQALLTLICGTLEAWKDEVRGDHMLPSLQEQIESLVKSMSSSTTLESLISVRQDYHKLKDEKDKLEKNLDDIISMYAEKQRLLKAIMEEKDQLEQQAEYQQGEILKLRQRVEELMEANDEVLAKNKELEKRVVVLEQEKQELTNKCKELERKQILVLLSKPAKTDAVLGINRSHSEGTYTEIKQPPLTTSLSEDHKTGDCVSLLKIDAVCCQAVSLGEKEESCVQPDSTESLVWIQTVNEMVKLCDEGSASISEGVEKIQRKLNCLKINQKLHKYS